MLIPANAAGQSLIKAYLEILVPAGVPTPIIPLRFNPTEYQLQKSNNFAEIPIPGLESPPIQFIRGSSEKLVADLIVDTSDTLEDVRKKYTNALRDLMRINADLHAPPIVRLTWDSQIFKGVVEALNISYTLFTPDGIPIRAKLNLTLKEYRPVEVQVKESPKSSPDVEKRYVVRRGDTLASIAGVAYGDPTQWREVARNNAIQDPRVLAPGRELDLPRLR
ncbi:MAG TPA: LysM peptidoglycan-binding domain-containing protein [Candidatus Cybelea sp.]|nr:LysM peptidoglycan-binding domain-containing protein [Candidatus Cybelea sp.]